MELKYLAQHLVKLKDEYLHEFHSYNHIREFIPVPNKQSLFDMTILEKLHTFFKHNKIYYNEQNLTLSDMPCISYEGDINQYWLSSKKYDTSYQPFFPTWGTLGSFTDLGCKRSGIQKYHRYRIRRWKIDLLW